MRNFEVLVNVCPHCGSAIHARSQLNRTVAIPGYVDPHQIRRETSCFRCGGLPDSGLRRRMRRDSKGEVVDEEDVSACMD
jgi:hypothetical protein